MGVSTWPYRNAHCLICCLLFSWANLGIKLASLARTHTDRSATIQDILSGIYIEAAVSSTCLPKLLSKPVLQPSVINALFLFFGSAFFLYVKAQQGPGPFAVATILACICLGRFCSSSNEVFTGSPSYRHDLNNVGFISLCILQSQLRVDSATFTVSNELSQIGQSVVIPLAFHSALVIVSSVLIFPTSVAAQHTIRLRAVIDPLGATFHRHLALLGIPTTSPEFSPKDVKASASKAENALAPLTASARLLRRDISWARFSGKDLDGMREKVQRLVMRAHGMNVYFSLIDPTRERFPVTPAPSHLASPAEGTPDTSRPSSPTRTEGSLTVSPARSRSTAGCFPPEAEQHGGRPASQRHPHFDVGHPSHSVKSYLHGTLFRRHHLRHSHISSFSGIHHHNHHHHHHHDNLREHVVGVFESQRYLDLESHHFAHPLAAHYTERTTALLRQSCEPLLRACHLGLRGLDSWLRTSRHKRWVFWWGGNKCSSIQHERLHALNEACDELARAVEAFRTSLRFVIFNP